MPVSSPVRHLDTDARRGRVWRSLPRTSDAPIDELDLELAELLGGPAAAPAARRGRVWRAPVAPAARRGRVWRGTPASRGGSLVALLLALLILAGGFGLSTLDDGPAVSHVASVPETADQVHLTTIAEQVGAADLWSRGFTGAGVNVAVIDTGVAPVPALERKVVAAVDVSADAGDPQLRLVDGYGHGTHLAGIVAGDDRASGFTGIAPGAGIVSVKVGDHSGQVTDASVLTGIDWVVDHADELGIRVITIALDTEDTSDYRTSELAAAVERAWRAGIVVVAAAGNDGASADGLSLPARDPFVLTVGGLDVVDGELNAATWTSLGDATRAPDVSAPGAHVMSLRAPGSVADVDHPEGYVSEVLFKGSGSSQSAAVVSGVVALLLDADPTLTPDQVKASLVATASPIAADAARVGAGLVRADAALGADVTPASQPWTPAVASTTTPRVAGVAVTPDWNGSSWTGSSWTGSSWTGSSWTGSSWTGSSWTGSSWTGSSWTGSSWTGSSWTGSSWTGSSWTGSSWTGSSWTGSSWTGSSWTGSSWTGSSWTGSSWTGSSWTGSSWTGSSWTGSSWTGSSWT